MKAASYIEAFRPPYSWIAGAHCGGVSRYIMEEGNVGVHTLLNTPTELEISLRARAIVMEALLGPILP